MKLESSLLRRGVATAGLLAGLMLGAGVALAQSSTNPTPPAPPPPAAGAPDPDHMGGPCKADPQRCAEMKQRMEERKAACAQGPDACKAWHKQERAKREAWCQANAQKCAEMKQRMEAHRAACKADPKTPHCGHMPPPGDGMPMEPPPPPSASTQ